MLAERVEFARYYFSLIKRCLKIFSIPKRSQLFPRIISIMDLFAICDFTPYFQDRKGDLVEEAHRITRI